MAKVIQSSGSDGGPWSRISGPEDFAVAFPVSRETMKRLEIYAELLAKWQKTINLVAPSTLDQIWHRHFADSAQLLERAPMAARVWVDLGSGAGFPGLVVAILAAGIAEAAGQAAAADQGEPTPELRAAQSEPRLGPERVILVESDSRKCAFLAEVIRKTGISGWITVEIVNRRIESAQTQASVGIVDVVSARALAPLGRLLAWSAPLFSSHTVALFLKGRDAEAEIEVARKDWRFDCRMWPSRTDPLGKLLEVQKIAANGKDGGQ